MKKALFGAVCAFSLFCAGQARAEENSIVTPKRILRDFYFEYAGCRGEGDDSGALRIHRKKTGALVQTLGICLDAWHDSGDDAPPAGAPDYRWTRQLHAGDFNFDGLEDFAVSHSCKDVHCAEDYYLYDPKRQQFRYGFDLFGYDMDFDPASKTIRVLARGNATTQYRTTYRVRDFALLPESTCTRSLDPAGPDAGIAATLSGGNLALDLRFTQDGETSRDFSGTVRFSLGKSALPQCLLRLKDKKVLTYDAKGQARRVAWTLDVHCGVKQFGTLSLVLSDTEGEWIQGSYRQLGDGKVIALKVDYFCATCAAGKGNCE
ncbi:MAG: hypothetical protein LBC37_02450 [Zoogloeaceae bacterium]|jgi:opacity protein-like surface antigen|nr:hypothetical protein [Zoogloeaceae bacterium]